MFSSFHKWHLYMIMNPTIWGALVFAFLRKKFCRFTAELGIFAAECEVARISRRRGQGAALRQTVQGSCCLGVCIAAMVPEH